MKQRLQSLLQQALTQLQQSGDLPADLEPSIQITHTKDASHGDFACNLAMMLAKPARKNPRQIAQSLVDALPADSSVEKVEIAGPGFINFYIRAQARHAVVSQILSQGEQFGRSKQGVGRKVQVEFVSANPTGPLHVGHGRGAAYGATVGNLLEAVGFEVQREYYVNDAGRQMDILATSVWLRYLQQCGEQFDFPSNGYQGDYVLTIAKSLVDDYADQFACPASEVFADIPADEPAGGDKEKHIDALIRRCKAHLNHGGYDKVFDRALHSILDDIRDDLAAFGVHYDEWFSERSLVQDGTIERAIEQLKASGHLYQQDGAWWFRSTEFGDEKDRVVVRDNGQTTYFASDIAYHLNKLERGFEIIDIWGADHHGYVPRVKAALQAMGADPAKLHVLLVQFAVLYRGGEKLQMSTRSGQFVTLRQLRDEVSSDAARYFYVMRKAEQHMDFDLDLARSQSNDNPLYYVQYAHARVCSVFRQMEEKGLQHDVDSGLKHLDRLSEPHELALVDTLSRYPEKLQHAALNYEPHQLTHYLRDLANDFHTYYNAHTFLVDDSALRNARLNLVAATKQVLRNGLTLIGVNAPDSM